MQRELQQTKQKLVSTEQELASTKDELASTKEKLASTEQELDRTKQELRGKNLGSMDKEALVKLMDEEALKDMQRLLDDAILRREVKREMEPSSAGEEPSSFICPITGSLMEDPVIASDGHSYERDAIQKWIRQQGAVAKSPSTGKRLAHRNLTPNHTLKKSIDEEIEKRMQEKKRQGKECKTQQGGSSSGKRKR